LFAVIHNPGPGIQTVNTASCRLDGATLGSIGNVSWARMWPPALPAGGRGVLRIKGTGSPLAAGSALTLEVATDEGASASTSLTLTDSPVTLGHAIHSPDSAVLYVYVRNISPSVTYVVDTLEVDGADSAASLLGGASLPPHSVGVARIAGLGTWTNLQHVSLAVVATPAGGGAAVLRVAGVRLTRPVFFTGSNGAGWTESIIRNGRTWFGHQLVGPTEYWDAGSIADRYFLGTLPIPFHGTPPTWDDASHVVNLRDNAPGLYAYYLADEPDLESNSEYAPAAVARGIANLFSNDTSHATFLNLARNKSFQDYALLVDHPCFDHYGQFAPLVYGGIFTTYSIKNSFWYTESLKRNAEPLRQWCFAQGVDAVWGTQPYDWGIKVQFWNHVIGGTKGILFFSAQPQYVVNHPAQQAAMEAMLQQLNHVRWAVAYGDVANAVTCSHADMLASMLVGERAVVVPVTDSTGTYTDGLLSDTASMSALSGQSIQFTVPDWIPLDRVREVTAAGLSTPGYSAAGRTVTISALDFDTTTPHRVFIAGAADTNAPAPVTNVRVAATSGATGYLSWPIPYDDTGIAGYQIYRDGTLLGTTETPLYADAAYSTVATYEILAYDADGNVTPRAAVTATQTVVAAVSDGTAVTGNVGVVNSGGSMLAWTAVSDAAWLVPSPASGQAAAGTTQALAFVVSPAGLAFGTYTATVTLNAPVALNGSHTIQVTLRVRGNPGTAVRPTDFDGLLLWLDGGDIDGQANATLAEDDAIATWINQAAPPDSIGDFTQGSQVLRPRFRHAVARGWDAIVAGGSGSHLESTNALVATSADPLTLMVVAEWDAASWRAVLSTFTEDERITLAARTADGGCKVEATGFSNAVTRTSRDGLKLMAVTRNPAGPTIEIGLNAATEVTAGSGTSSPSDVPSAVAWDGPVAEIIAYNRVLSVSEGNALVRYLTGKYGILPSHVGTVFMLY
jgi:hypothetical protein